MSFTVAAVSAANDFRYPSGALLSESTGQTGEKAHHLTGIGLPRQYLSWHFAGRGARTRPLTISSISTIFIHHISAPDIYRRPQGMTVDTFTDQLLAEFEAKVEELGADRVAAFLAEPIVGSGGVMVPPSGYLQHIRQRCAELDIFVSLPTR